MRTTVIRAALILSLAAHIYGQENRTNPDRPESSNGTQSVAKPTPNSEKESDDDEEASDWFARAPDESLFAIGRIIPDRVLIQRYDLDGVAVAIYSDRESVIARHDFPGRRIAHMEWSPDSKFLLFTTTSSGGHSPWHSAAFLYCVGDKNFHDLDTAIGTVMSPKFRFEIPDVAILMVKKGDSPEEEMRVQLAKTVHQMPRAK